MERTKRAFALDVVVGVAASRGAAWEVETGALGACRARTVLVVGGIMMTRGWRWSAAELRRLAARAESDASAGGVLLGEGCECEGGRCEAKEEYGGAMLLDREKLERVMPVAAMAGSPTWAQAYNKAGLAMLCP